MTKFQVPNPLNHEPKVIYENKNFIGIYKPAGLLVHPTHSFAMCGVHPIKKGSEEEPTLVDWLLKNYPEVKNVGDLPAGRQVNLRPGIVHRLDKDTSGVMLVPRNQEYFEYFKELFKTRQIKKTYLALVSGELKEKEGVIDKPIGIKTGSVKRSVHSEKMKKNAVTSYKVKKTFAFGGEKVSLLEVFPETGRTHQIRVHLASIGHPILGDKLYGGKKQKEKAGRLMLHAYSIEFSLPDHAGRPGGSRVKLESEPDDTFLL
ncbi:MAG TPA: RluA family pseudouridine synthase [Candidatus Paceibacterota bacterium]|nr:RluA family pseudouridine synthase [Candidatus Paceibacterota bacterium]